jgi:transcriptional regulator with GAF, ATPase, and Fis domain
MMVETYNVVAGNVQAGRLRVLASMSDRVEPPHNSHDAGELRKAMELQGGNQSRAAQALSLTTRQCAYRWKRLNER